MTGIARAARWLGVRDLAVVVIVVAALCWVLADEDRSRRLAEVVGAWRGTRPRPASQLVGKASGRRRRQWTGAGSEPPVLPGGGTPPTG